MGSSGDEGQSRPKRPAAMSRQHSSQSQVSQSPSESHQRPQHKATRHHVVGSRVQRNPSTGKHLNKLAKAAQPPPPAADDTARHHRRSQSGNSVSAPSSPRPGFKRNASTNTIVRASQAHAHANLRKNHSSGHLARQGQAKQPARVSKNDIAAARRALATPNRSRPSSPDAHPAVDMDPDSDHADNDGWTEESASQSPTTTRSNTRSNSLILEQQRDRVAQAEAADETPPTASTTSTANAQAANALADRTRNNTQANGGTSHHHSRPPDADMLTSRLLQRSSTSTSNLTVHKTAADRETPRSVLPAHSAASTLVDTPGKDLVSRFMDGHGSAGTPANGEYMPPRDDPTPDQGDLDESKRNKSTSNVQRSGTTTPTLNRTQQKLLLQRASSAIEPQKLVPAVMARAGGSAFFPSGMHYHANGQGRVDPRLQQQFNHVAVEYRVVRRYRNPLADSIWRIQQIPGVKQKMNTRVSKSVSLNGSASTTSLSTSLTDAGGHGETDGASSRRSRLSFDAGGRTSRDDEDPDRESLDEEHARPPTEAEEICRRMWESAEAAEAD
ncbi:hypothetical protein P153DRAFT_371402 [Dothidotthia symphoricarpi CBS 119687]|uniref:Uncharacterized protein n=1 Tax=Dothidotthia symphoricarpi CBS 119687 TaxID=1392245 RepID=A0A6A5ZYY6_9PLEO|nr:uncharacterized protein P153DRAFT_371402 [Dothidotthia symphoricarpi CBS 119687]KAF2124093.1 hypothetical protein P153DRAFT_371402 [Dothidotthia symphoricarpi CBS 119687]